MHHLSGGPAEEFEMTFKWKADKHPDSDGDFDLRDQDSHMLGWLRKAEGGEFIWNECIPGKHQRTVVLTSISSMRAAKKVVEAMIHLEG